MEIFEDKYILKNSVSIQLDETESYFISLILDEEQNDILAGQIYGFVKDERSEPVENAYIYIMSEDYVCLMETVTDDDGNFLIMDVTPNVNYRIYVVADGKQMQNSVMFTIENLERYELNFILKDTTIMDFVILKGNVIDSVSQNPIKYAVVYIFSVDINNDEELISIETSDENGEFIFWQLQQGNYIIKTSAAGCKINNVYQSIIENNQEIEITIPLYEENKIINGTIYGIIKDSNGNPIPSADVILYEVDSNNILTPIKFTKTDNDGVYLFADVVDGNYKIKANKLAEEDI